MSAAFPALSIDEQKALLDSLRRLTPYPYYYGLNVAVDPTFFTATDGSGGYFTLTFTAPSALGIVAIETSCFMLSADVTSTFALVISYSPVLPYSSPNSQANSIFDQPGDSGNNLYSRTWSGQDAIFDYQRYHPYPYYMAFGQQLFIYVWADNSILAANTATMRGGIILHTYQTGLKA